MPHPKTPSRATASSCTSPPSPLLPLPVVAVSSTNVLLISLAVLVSSGLLVRTFHPKYRYRTVSNTAGGAGSSSTSKGGKKRRETVVKSIIQAQEELADSLAAAASPSGSFDDPSGMRTRSSSTALATTDKSRGRSGSLAASTSTAVAAGLARLSTVGSLSTPSSSRPASGSSTPTLDGSFLSPTSTGYSSADSSSKKGKGKKGKGVASAATLAPPPAAGTHHHPNNTGLRRSPYTSPSPSPSRASSPLAQREMKDSTASCNFLPPLPTIDASVQTHSPLTILSPTPLRPPAPPITDSFDPDFVFPPLPDSPPPIEYPSTQVPLFAVAYRDAQVQTITPPPPPPSLPSSSTSTRFSLPYDLHASFQSTPARPHHAIPNRPPPPHPSPSPPPSPSPTSRGMTKLRLATQRAPSPSRDSGSGSANSSRSRKQTRKLSSNAATNIVPGMARPARSRQRSEDSEASLLSPILARSIGSVPGIIRMVDSPEIAPNILPGRQVVGLPLTMGMGAPKGEGSTSNTRGSRGSGGGKGSMAGTANGSGAGRYGIPSPIPIPPHSNSSNTPHHSNQRRSSTNSTASTNATNSSYSNVASISTSSTSPHPNSHLSFSTMTPPDTALRSTNGRKARSTNEADEAYWKGDRSAERDGRWISPPSSVVGLGVGMENLSLNGDEERGRGTKLWSEAAGGARPSRSRTSSPNISNDIELSSSADPDTSSQSESYFPSVPLLSPPTSPQPIHTNLLSFATSVGMPHGQPWSPQLLAGQHGMNPFPPPPFAPPPSYQSALPGAAHASSTTTTQSSSGNLSRPASRQSSLSVPTNSQQQQQHIATQHAQHLHQQQQAYAYAHAQAQAQYQHAVALQIHAQQQQAQRQAQDLGLANGGRSGGTAGSPAAATFAAAGHQLPQMPVGGWNALTNSNAVPNSISPTSTSFPPIYPYYLQSPTPSYMSGYHLTSPGLPPRQQSTTSNNKSRKSSPRIGTEKPRSSSISSTTNGTIAGEGSELATIRAKLRNAEMEADRNGKELEIAKWRLSVLEQDRLASEVESQEALSVLVDRTRRAEARLKALEDARVLDSSSTSGSGSPSTRPASLAEGVDMAADPLPPSDGVEDTFIPSRGVGKLHPLAWLDLDTINFSTHQSQPRPQSSGSFRRPRNGRLSAEHSGGSSGSNHRKRTKGRRSAASSQQSVNDEEEDLVIVLDSTSRRASRAASRRSSFHQDDLDQDGSFASLASPVIGDDDDGSSVGVDESGDSDRPPLDFVGFLPTFRKVSSSVSVDGSPTINYGDISRESYMSIPSFIVDCATPSPLDESSPFPVPSVSDDGDHDSEDEDTPHIGAALSPVTSPAHETPVAILA